MTSTSRTFGFQRDDHPPQAVAGRLQRGRVYGVSKSVVDDDGAFGDCLENAATILG